MKHRSDSDSVLNRGTEPIICFIFGFALKYGFVLPAPIMGIGMGSRFCFSVFMYGFDGGELGSIYYNCDLYY